MIDTQPINVTSAKRNCANAYANHFFTTGAYGTLYQFSRDDDDVYNDGARFGCVRTIGSLPPKYLILKMSRSFSKIDVERECLDTGQHRIRDEGLVLSDALLILVEGNGSYVEKILQTPCGGYVSFCVMPKYDCDLYQYLQQHRYRSRMQRVGEEGFLQIVRVLLRALVKLRTAGYVYADLKLTNILVNPFVLSDTPMCVLGDVGSICEVDQCYAAPCSFPSPTGIVTDGRMGVGCVWTFGIFMLEYVINLYDVVRYKSIIYREFLFKEYASQREKLSHVTFIRENLQTLRMAIPDTWTTVHLLCEKCFYEERVAVGMCSTGFVDLLRVMDKPRARVDPTSLSTSASARLTKASTEYEQDQMPASI
ncbi:hypothetical protein CYMTET_44636 [Cymbomonas tetramitiformis]|uniref:Protein kinase domain-containing protein n=1 Tax=Cymbomonas tetramitiformis TaxID=36881 RepID=A0AAE0F0H7_9CHLO|nr:hypothetical protein CYMTET_44636 [Cymbomonas tetramitiformis]